MSAHVSPRHPCRPVLAAALLTVSAGGCRFASTGSPAAPPAAPASRTEASLRGILDAAIGSGAGFVRIPPGVYRLGPGPSGKAHLLFEGVHNLTIDATGVELIMTDGLKTSLVAIYNCRNLTLKGLTVDCDPVTFLQGRIAGMAPDRAWYDLRVDPGFGLDPVADNLRMRPMNIIDGNTPELSWKHGVPDLFPERVEWVPGEDRLLRVHVLPHCRGEVPVEVGDPAVFPAYGAPGFTCRGSVDIAFENCTITQSGSMAFHEHGGDGNTRLLHCRVMRRPGSGRLLSTNADGFHSKNMRQGPTVAGCLFEGMHDDGINIHGMFAAVAETVADSATVTIVPYFEESGKAGDTIEFFSGETGASLGSRALRQAVQLGSGDRAERAKTYHRGSGYGLLYRYELDAPISLDKHDAAINLDLCGRGFAIRDCDFRAFRYRGMLLRTMDGVVENNRLFALGNDGIVLQSDLFTEGPYPCNVTVRNNTVAKVGMIPFMNSGRGISVWTHAHTIKTDTGPLRLNRDIVIENNRISDVTRDGIYLRNTIGIILRGNAISDVGRRPVYAKVPPQPVSAAEVDRFAAD